MCKDSLQEDVEKLGLLLASGKVKRRICFSVNLLNFKKIIYMYALLKYKEHENKQPTCCVETAWKNRQLAS